MASLDDLRRKVEAGERLSDSELELLKQAAQEQTGPTLRLALAHALVNANASEQALPLLERLARDYPRDVQVHLGHARALISLERYTEADKPVRTALTLSPQDPEGMKALAVLAMRRGETTRARALVTDVLRIDPFDGEARMLKEELDAAEFPPAAAASSGQGPSSERVAASVPRAQFAEALGKALAGRGMVPLRGEDHFLVKLGPGRVARVDLSSLYNGYLSEGRPLGEAVDALAQELSGGPLELPTEREALLGSVLPVLRAPAFLDKARSAASREGPAGLLVYYVIEDPKLVRYVPLAALEGRRVSLEEVDQSAWENLTRRLTELRPALVERGEVRLARESTGLWALCEEDGHDSARLLVAAQRQRIRQLAGAGPYRVGLGQREVTLLCRAQDAAAVRMLESQALAPDGIPGRFVLDDSGALVQVSEPEPD